MNKLVLSGPAARVGPDWWSSELRLGQTVELSVYGDQMTGRLVGFEHGLIEVAIPLSEQVLPLRVASVSGTAVISVEGGAASTSVLCWAQGDRVRLQVLGPVELVQRRLHVRRSLDVAVALTWTESDPAITRRAIGRTADISVGGLRIRSASVVWPSPGDSVGVVLDSPGGPLGAEALVIGKTPDYGLRLRFIGCRPDTTARIASFVSEGRADL